MTSDLQERLKLLPIIIINADDGGIICLGFQENG